MAEKATDNGKLAADAVVAEAVAGYAETERTISAMIVAAATAEKPYTRKQLNTAIAELRAEISKLDSFARPVIARSILASYAEGATMAEQVFEDAGINVSGKLNPQDRRAIAILVDNASKKMSEVHSLVGRRVEDLLRQEGLKAARVVIEKRSAGAGQKALMQALSKQGMVTQVKRGRLLVNVVPIKGKDGKVRNYLLSDYSRMVSFTTSREAHSHAVANRITDKFAAGIISSDAVTVTSHIGGDDAICGPLQGRTFSLTGADKRYPRLPAYPPFHPRCRHLLTPGPVRPVK